MEIQLLDIYNKRMDIENAKATYMMDTPVDKVNPKWDTHSTDVLMVKGDLKRKDEGFTAFIGMLNPTEYVIDMYMIQNFIII